MRARSALVLLTSPSRGLVPPSFSLCSHHLPRGNHVLLLLPVRREPLGPLSLVQWVAGGAAQTPSCLWRGHRSPTALHPDFRVASLLLLQPSFLLPRSILLWLFLMGVPCTHTQTLELGGAQGWPVPRQRGAGSRTPVCRQLVPEGFPQGGLAGLRLCV